MIRRSPRSTLSSSSAASDVYKRQFYHCPAQKTHAPVSAHRFQPRSLAPPVRVVASAHLVVSHRQGAQRFQRAKQVQSLLVAFHRQTRPSCAELPPFQVLRATYGETPIPPFRAFAACTNKAQQG